MMITALDAQLVKVVGKLPTGLQSQLKDAVGKRWASLLLALLALFSVFPVASVIGWGVTLLAVAGVAVLLVLCRYSEYCTSLVVVLGAVVLPWLSLVTFNFLLGWLIRPLHLGLWTSLVVAGLVFAAAACAYLLVWREHRIPAVIVAVALAAANVVGVPMLLGAKESESAVRAPQPVVSQLDLAIVVPGGEPTTLERVDGAKTQRDWDVRWSVGRVSDAGVGWLLLDSIDPDAALAAARGSGAPLTKAPTWRAGADHVLLLDVDGTPPVVKDPKSLPSVRGRSGEVARWLRIADQAAPGAQVAVLLQTTDQARLDAWSKRVEAKGGSVASVQRLGSRSLTDAAQVLAVQTPGASEDLALAARFRPILLFDRREKLNSPLDVDGFFASGRVSLCHDDKFDGARCSRVDRASGLVSGPTHLAIRPARRGDPAIGTAIYVHPTTRRESGRTLLYLDYWWYLDGNPAKIGDGATCGVGLAMPGKTCFDHPSDWEGLTVVVDVTGEEARPLAVQYAQHKDVVRYDWAQLQARWARLRANPRSGLSAEVRRNLSRISDVADRPVAFVGRGTHATYAQPCTGSCHQTLSPKVTENDYGGEVSWSGNDTATCVAITCVRLLPTRHAGRDPALWNAFTGVWGDRSCILNGSYCTAELSPGAPSTQQRYRDPTRIAGWVDAAQLPHRCGGSKGACP